MTMSRNPVQVKKEYKDEDESEEKNSSYFIVLGLTTISP
jgi:hypothetical protein